MIEEFESVFLTLLEQTYISQSFATNVHTLAGTKSITRDLQTSKNKISIGGLLDMPIYKGGIPPNVCNKLQSQIDAMTLLILDDVALAQRP